MAAPKSLKDFKKQNSSNNNSILSSGKFKSMHEENNTANQSTREFFGGESQSTPIENYPQSDFPTDFKPNFDAAYQQAMETPVADVIQPQPFGEYPAQSDNQSQQQNDFFQNVAEYDSQQSQQESNAPVMSSNDYQSEQTQQNAFNQGWNNQNNKPQGTQQSYTREQIPEEKPLTVQAYQTINKHSDNNEKRQNKSIVSHMQEVEQEINGLVSNTEAFLNNTKLLKVKILNAKNLDELSSVMQETKRTLEDVPESFIDAETRRRIRVCFSYLQKQKKELLETEIALKKTQEDLKRLVSIDNIEELENAILEVPASPVTDNVYEIRTFEINLVNQLPAIKEEMLKEKMLQAYH